MVDLVASGLYACVLGSRILGGQALEGGMPVWRYVANRGLTLVGNLLLGTKVSEFHTGYRAYSRDLLEQLPLDLNSDDFVFDNEVLAETAWLGYRIGEVSCPTRYAPDASSIDFLHCVTVRHRVPQDGARVPLEPVGHCSLDAISAGAVDALQRNLQRSA